MELVSLVGLAILATIVCALLVAGFMLAPWLMLLGLIGLLLLVVWRFPLQEWQTQNGLSPEESSPASASTASPQQLTYRGAPCPPPTKATDAIEVVQSGKYRGNPWTSSPTGQKSSAE